MCRNAGVYRHDFDLEVGKLQTSFSKVAVSGGMAAIQELKNGQLTTFSSAPGIQFRVEFLTGAVTTWLYEARNLVPGSAITIVSDTGTVIPVSQKTTISPTRTSWSFDRGAFSYVDITLSPPGTSSGGSFRLAVLSDIQRAIDKVQDIYDKVNSDSSIEFIISAGDLTANGTEEEMQTFQDKLKGLNVPLYATPGNHDAFAGFTPWQKYFGRGSFQFQYKGVFFTFIDTGKAGVEAPTYAYLESWLNAGLDYRSVVLAHIAPIEPSGVRDGAFSSKPEALRVIELLTRYRVDLSLYGHVHSYFKYSHAGIPAYISGGGGALPMRFDGINRHYLTVDFNPGSIDVNVVRVD